MTYGDEAPLNREYVRVPCTCQLCVATSVLLPCGRSRRECRRPDKNQLAKHAGDVPPPLDRDGEPFFMWSMMDSFGSTTCPGWHCPHGEVPQHGGGRGLHMHERHLLAQAGPRTGVVGRLVPHLPVARDLPLRPKLHTVLAPHASSIRPM